MSTSLLCQQSRSLELVPGRCSVTESRHDSASPAWTDDSHLITYRLGVVQGLRGGRIVEGGWVLVCPKKPVCRCRIQEGDEDYGCQLKRWFTDSGAERFIVDLADKDSLSDIGKGDLLLPMLIEWAWHGRGEAAELHWRRARPS